MNLKERYGEEVGAWLEDIIAYETKKFDCVDNIRVAERGVWQEEEEFIVKEKNGCCAIFDDQWTYKGRRFLIGWNYGH